MIINLKQLFNIIGESKDFDFSIPLEDLSDIHGCNFCSPLHLKGRLFNRAGVVYIKYSVDFNLLIACDRCLKEFERGYQFDFEHIVVPSLSNDDNDDYIVADDESIDLNEIAVSDSILQLPSKFLCSDDCKGLCMVCGCNLNESDCDCLK